MILRDKDADTGWDEESDGVLEQRYYFCRVETPSPGSAGEGRGGGDFVSAVVTSGGAMVQWVNYSAYGVPFGLPAGDTDSDGDCDQADIDEIDAWINGSVYDVRGDLNLDGVVYSTDKSLAQNNHQGTTLGWNTLSTTATGLRHSYAGYHWCASLTGLYHVRNRVYSAELGRWTRRDPLGYVDGMNLYEYVAGRAITATDPTGLAAAPILADPIRRAYFLCECWRLSGQRCRECCEYCFDRQSAVCARQADRCNWRCRIRILPGPLRELCFDNCVTAFNECFEPVVDWYTNTCLEWCLPIPVPGEGLLG